ncbi:hypothetical protein AB0I45_08575 [Brevibacterium sp. NPDC049920]|uniref:CzcB-like C-terminal circularly permuted SH3-like domain-containing protein n=1 Tax=Brevibacterium pityocampae TaxID=506594 RepID=A0ABP8JHZ6_9MICO
MQLFRRVILPTGFLVVLLVIAIALAWIAFRPTGQAAGGGEEPSGTPLSTEVVVERGTITNTMTVSGTIRIDPAKPVEASHAGTINHLFVAAGAEVRAGDQLFQIRAEETSEPAPEPAPGTDPDAAEPAPAPPAAPRYRYHTVVAPADGTLGEFTQEIGDEVAKGTPVTSVAQRIFRAVGVIEPIDLYRLTELPDSAEITITKGPEPFDCTGLRIDQGSTGGDDGGDGAGYTAGPESTGGSEGTGEADPAPAEDAGAAPDPGGGDTVSLTCLVPDEVTVYNRLPMTMEVDAGSVEDALIVPVTAVRGLTEKGTVWTIGADGTEEERAVELGMSDGTMVEVVSGLEEGEAIAEFVPGTAPEQAADDPGEFGGEGDW